MSEQQDGSDQSEGQQEETNQPRDGKGRFTQKNETVNNGQSQPSSSEYTKINSILAKQLGITDRLADYQTKFAPRELFQRLEFMVENASGTPQGSQQGSGRPPNQPIAPISPEPNKIDLPGVEWLSKPNLTHDKFSASFKMNPRQLLKKDDK